MRRENASGTTGRQRAALRAVLDDFIQRRSSGQFISPEALYSSHPNLMPELARQIKLLSVLDRAAECFRQRADSSGPAQDQLTLHEAIAIPGYSILSEHHRGGQGVVHLAVQQSTNRRVAIKVMREGPFALRSEASRFEREVRILAQLRHPNIVTIYDSGQAAGHQYFVMDYIDGQPLDAHVLQTGHVADDRPTTVRSAMRSTDQTLQLFALICDAVNAAHLRGIIHRDLKPSNILVDRSGQPHVLDFGLARITGDEADAASSAMTQTGQFIGSLPWTSPEQSDGQLTDLRTDVYSLGVVFYQCLTGRFPYSVTGRPGDIAARIRTQPPQPLRSLEPTLDGDIETIILKCLSKERERRYQSAGELARDIRHFLAGEAIEAKRQSTLYVLAKTLRRHRIAVGIAAAFILVVAAGGATSLALWRRAITQRDRAVAAEQQQVHERERAAGEAAKAQAVSTFLQEMLASADPNVSKNADLTVKQALEAAKQKLDTGSFADQPEVAISLRRTLGETYSQLGSHAEADTQLRKALEGARQAWPGDHEETARILFMTGVTLDREGMYRDGEAMLRDALAMFRRLPGGTNHYVPICLNELAISQKTQGNRDEAEKLYRESLEITKSMYGAESVDVCFPLNNLAILLAGKGQLDESESMQRQVLAIRRKLLGDDHPEVAASLNSLAALMMNRGNLEQAEQMFRDSLAIRRKVLGDEHPDIATSINNLGLLVDTRSRYDEAVQLHRQALEMRRTLLGANHTETAASLNNLALALSHKKDFEAAEPLYREALDILRKGFGDAHPHIALGLMNLVDLLEAKGDHTGAEPLLRETLEIRLKLYGPRHLDVAKTRGRLGLCLNRNQKYDEAESILRACLKTRRKLLPSDDWLIANTQSLLGQALSGQQKYEDAESLLIEGHEGLSKNPKTPPERLRDSIERLAGFYKNWDAAAPGTGKADKADQWRSMLVELKSPDSVSSARP